jgi:hypothetical protein
LRLLHSRRSSTGALAVLCLALLCCGRAPGQASQQNGAETKTQAEFYQDFRGNKPHPAFQWDGMNGEETIANEAQGLRIKLPLNRDRKDPGGLALSSPLKGDFEITAGYELVAIPVPKTGNGVGFELFVMLNAPTRDGFPIARLKRRDGSDEYACGHNKTVDGKRRFNGKSFPATATAGQLRLQRKGTRYTFSATEGVDGAFKNLCSYDGDASDVRLVRLAAYPGQAAEAVEVRFVELRLRGDLNPELLAKADMRATAPPDTPADPAASAAAPAPQRGWLLIAVGIGALIALASLVTVGLAILLRRRRPGSHDKAAAVQALGPVTTEPITFTCPSCGKGLKVRAELAGKKVKCPHCGKPAHAGQTG